MNRTCFKLMALTMKSAAAYPCIVSRWFELSTGREVYLHIQHLFKISTYYADRDILQTLPSIRL